MTWEQVGPDKIHCTRHDETFGRRGTCTKCLSDPPPLDLEEPETLPEAPDGCRSSVEHERRLTALADFAEEQGRALCRGKGRINYATAAKLLEVALKAVRSAGEYSLTRERRARVARLERRFRELAARRGGRN